MKALEEIMQDPMVSKTILTIVCDEEGKFHGKVLADNKPIITSATYSKIQNVLNDLEMEARRIIGDVEI